MNVREKAKQLVAMLSDDERLKNERAKALKAKERFAQNAIGVGNGHSTGPRTRVSLNFFLYGVTENFAKFYQFGYMLHLVFS